MLSAYKFSFRGEIKGDFIKQYNSRFIIRVQRDGNVVIYQSLQFSLFQEKENGKLSVVIF